MTTTEKPKPVARERSLPPVGSADDLSKMLTLLRRYERQLKTLSESQRDWILESLRETFSPNPFD